MTEIKNYTLWQILCWVGALLRGFVKGRHCHSVSFEQDSDGRWYVILPGWPLDRRHLEMVAGADDMLSLLDCNKEHLVRVSIITSKAKAEHEGCCQLTCIKKSLTGGAFYTVQGLSGWDNNPNAIREKELWLCPVTLCVLGCYPKYIYVRRA